MQDFPVRNLVCQLGCMEILSLQDSYMQKHLYSRLLYLFCFDATKKYLNKNYPTVVNKQSLSSI